MGCVLLMCEMVCEERSFVGFWVEVWVAVGNCEKSRGRARVARGRRDEREAQMMALPTSTMDQLSELTTWSVGWSVEHRYLGWAGEMYMRCR